MHEITVRTASGTEFVVPGVKPGREWQVTNELTRLLGERVDVAEEVTRPRLIRQKKEQT